MKNIDYLESFFRKHHLTGKVTVRYTSPTAMDDYMSDIVFEDESVININDVIFDIDSDFPRDVAEQWMKVKKTNDISLVDWIKGHLYMPDMDMSSIQQYQQELETVMNDVKESIITVFNREINDGDSEENDESEDE